ncbi:hypothetical protein P3G55_04645 [Leptospira sp. 96542]|nr:hypothetical protein [Leptospira sp. 96542]
MKKHLILLFLFLVVFVFDLSKDQTQKFGVKANLEEKAECTLICDKVVRCMPKVENEVVSPEILKLTCGVLCNKQHQLFSQCKSSLETSCPNFVSCVQKVTNGLF